MSDTPYLDRVVRLAQPGWTESYQRSVHGREELVHGYPKHELRKHLQHGEALWDETPPGRVDKSGKTTYVTWSVLAGRAKLSEPLPSMHNIQRLNRGNAPLPYDPGFMERR